MTTSKLEELFGDVEFARFFNVIVRELARTRCMSPRRARSIVLSALGDPREAAKIHAAWTGGSRGLAKWMVRCRVIDLLRMDRRRPRHESLPEDAEEMKIANDAPEQLEHRDLVRVILTALECFARQSEVQRRQAELLRRYKLEEATYEELRAELGVSLAALRVRVHTALREFQLYLKAYLGARDPELSRRIPG